MDENALSHEILGAAIDVHKELGPGLLESVYEEGLVIELYSRGLSVARQNEIVLTYKGRELHSKLRLDLVVNDLVIVEVKAIERLASIHESQLLTYLRLANKNFNATTLKNSIGRVVNNL